MKRIKRYSEFLLCALIISSCEKEKNNEQQSFHLTKGVFVVNEGAYNSSNGDISFFSDDGIYKIRNLFFTINKRPLGDVIQSMSIIDSKGYIIANHSQKIEVVSMDNFFSTGVINGLASPRYMLSINNNEAYVSDWIDNNIKIVNLNSLCISGTIPTGNGPEQMLKVGDKVYVTNVGGFGNDSTVTVINSITNLVDTTLRVGVNPNSIITDINGNIWIMCGGSLGADFTPNTADDIGGNLIKIDPSTNIILSSFNFSQGEHPLKIFTNADKTKIYFLRGSSAYTGNVCVMEINATSLPVNPIVNREFYGLGVNPKSENIYGGIGSFSTNSWILHYKSNGTLIDSMQVGIGPNGFVFN